MKILIFDNYDSFTYNLVHLVKDLGYNDIEIHRNDKILLDDIKVFDKIILSPGPGIPSEAGILLQLIKRYAANKSIFGVCLGHQALAEAFGATLLNLEEVYHGIATPVKIIGDDYIFKGLEPEIEAGRYHSWIVDRANLPSCIRVTAVGEHNEIMAIRHIEHDLHGVQFHPESVLTPVGKAIVANFLNNAD